MNILVSELSREPDLLRDSTEDGQVRIDRLMSNVVPQVWPFIALDADGSVAMDVDARRTLDASYLPFIDRERWERAFADAEAAFLPPATDEATDWVIYHSTGVTLPQDDSSREHLSFFARLGRELSIARFYPEESIGEIRVELSSSEQHCGFPDDGSCDPGKCGQCVARVREVGGEYGLICWCEH